MPPTITIPPHLAATIAGVYGDRGRDWVANAPDIIRQARDRWQINLEPPFDNLSYNYVAPGTLPDGTPVVLKAGVPSRELDDEIAALRHFGGRAAARVIDADPSGAVVLLERIVPGSPLSTLDDDDEETRIAARIMQSLWRKPPLDHEFKTLAHLFQAFQRLRARFDGDTGPLPPDLVALAEKLAADLLATSPSPMLLHGDFHHHNVLRDTTGEWRIIDPPGAVGDPAAEPGMFLCNPHDRIENCPDLPALVARRIDILAEELPLDRGRIVRWAVAWAMLSACWCVEDNAGCEDYAVRCARALVTLLPE